MSGRGADKQRRAQSADENREPRIKAKGNFKPVVDQKLISALSHPLRAHILDVVSEAIASPSDLAREVGLDVNYVAYHVKELEKTGYLKLVKTEPRRGAVEHYYRASKKFVLDDAEWERLPKAVRQGLSVNLFRIIVSEVKEAVEAGTFDVRDGHLSRTRLLVDEKGLEDLNAVLLEALERVFAIQAECEKRIEKTEEKPTPVTASMVVFETSPRSNSEREAKVSKASATG